MPGNQFQSTLPVWGATVGLFLPGSMQQFQSTLPVWGATYTDIAYMLNQLFQSTLPVWGATLCSQSPDMEALDFNPRSPCGERRRDIRQGRHSSGFQSTLPVWGATMMLYKMMPDGAISIHAPRVGSDQPCPGHKVRPGRFQSTLPVWGATRQP